MSQNALSQFNEVLPKQGLHYQEDIPTTVLCKPKLMPLKSVMKLMVYYFKFVD